MKRVKASRLQLRPTVWRHRRERQDSSNVKSILPPGILGTFTGLVHQLTTCLLSVVFILRTLPRRGLPEALHKEEGAGQLVNLPAQIVAYALLFPVVFTNSGLRDIDTLASPWASFKEGKSAYLIPAAGAFLAATLAAWLLGPVLGAALKSPVRGARLIIAAVLLMSALLLLPLNAYLVAYGPEDSELVSQLAEIVLVALGILLAVGLFRSARWNGRHRLLALLLGALGVLAPAASYWGTGMLVKRLEREEHAAAYVIGKLTGANLYHGGMKPVGGTCALAEGGEPTSFYCTLIVGTEGSGSRALDLRRAVVSFAPHDQGMEGLLRTVVLTQWRADGDINFVHGGSMALVPSGGLVAISLRLGVGLCSRLLQLRDVRGRVQMELSLRNFTGDDAEPDGLARIEAGNGTTVGWTIAPELFRSYIRGCHFDRIENRRGPWD